MFAIKLKYGKQQTCNFSHPLKIPSSNARILLPDKSNILKWVNGRNSAVEKIGFNESPKRLSDNFKIVNVPCKCKENQQKISELRITKNLKLFCIAFLFIHPSSSSRSIFTLLVSCISNVVLLYIVFFKFCTAYLNAREHLVR